MKKQLILLYAIVAWLMFSCSYENGINLDRPKSLPLSKASAFQADGFELDSLARNTKDGCQLGIAIAKADEQKGIIGYYFWGIAISSLAGVLSKQYGVKVFTRGCTVFGAEGEARSCYNDYMRQVLLRKYKQDVIAVESEKVRQESENLVKQIWMESEKSKRNQ